MEIDELKWKTNKELADLLEYIGMTSNFNDSSDALVIYEAAKRLKIKPKTLFNDEQFNM